MKKPPFAGEVRNGIITHHNVQTGEIAVYPPGISMLESGSFVSVKSKPWPPRSPRQLPFNPFEHTVVRESRFPGEFGHLSSYWGRFDGYKGYCHDHIHGRAHSWPTAQPQDAEWKARMDLLEKIKDQSINLAQAFAERRQTVDLITKNVNRIAAGAMAIRRGNLSHASKIFGGRQTGHGIVKDIKPSPINLSNHWLEYSYGWRPLLQDVRGGAEQIAKSFQRNYPNIVRSKSSSSVPIKNHVMFEFLAPPNSCLELCDGAQYVDCSYVVEVAVNNELAYRMSQTGISNPALLAWELLPYSFVIDWFVPVGTYLSALDATNGLVIRNGSQVIKTREYYTTSWRSQIRDSQSTYIKGLGRTLTRESKRRSTLSSFPTPSLPTPQPSMSVSRCLSAIALLTQAFSR